MTEQELFGDRNLMYLRDNKIVTKLIGNSEQSFFIPFFARFPSKFFSTVYIYPDGKKVIRYSFPSFHYNFNPGTAYNMRATKRYAKLFESICGVVSRNYHIGFLVGFKGGIVHWGTRKLMLLLCVRDVWKRKKNCILIRKSFIEHKRFKTIKKRLIDPSGVDVFYVDDIEKEVFTETIDIPRFGTLRENAEYRKNLLEHITLDSIEQCI